MERDDCHPVGTVEIAALLGVERVTVSAWRTRGRFIPPRWTVGGMPLWNLPDVERWARQEGYELDPPPERRPRRGPRRRASP
jgi:hypothetical protein